MICIVYDCDLPPRWRLGGGRDQIECQQCPLRHGGLAAITVRPACLGKHRDFVAAMAYAASVLSTESAIYTTAEGALNRTEYTHTTIASAYRS